MKLSMLSAGLSALATLALGSASYGNDVPDGLQLAVAEARKAVSSRRVPSMIKRSWRAIPRAQAARAVGRAEVDNGSIAYITEDNELANVEPESVVELAKKGLIKVYVNDKDSCEPYDETGEMVCSKGYYFIVPSKSPLAEAAEEADRLIARAERASAAVKKGLEEFHGAIHASNVNGLGHELTPEYLRRMKAKANEARKRVPAVIEAYEAAAKAWEAAAAKLRSGASGTQAAFVSAVLQEAGPALSGGGMSLEDAKAILAVDDLVFDRPEIMSVDPGFSGVRIELDVEQVVRRDGTVKGYVKDLKALIKNHGIKTRVDVEERLKLSAIQERIVAEILAPALGKENVGQYGYSEDNSGKTFDFYVKPEAFEKAQELIPRIRKAFEPYDLDGRPIKIEKIDW